MSSDFLTMPIKNGGLKVIQELGMSSSLSGKVIGAEGVGHCSFTSEKHGRQTARLQNISG